MRAWTRTIGSVCGSNSSGRPKDIDRNRIGLDGPAIAGERPVDHVTKQFGELWRARNPLPAKDFVQGGADAFGLGTSSGTAEPSLLPGVTFPFYM